MRIYHYHSRLVFLSYEQFVEDIRDGLISAEQTKAPIFFLIGSRTQTLRDDSPVALRYPWEHKLFVDAVTKAEKECRAYWYDRPIFNEREVVWLFNALLSANGLTDHPLYLRKDAEVMHGS